jgi:hypothetical protein
VKEKKNNDPGPTHKEKRKEKIKIGPGLEVKGVKRNKINLGSIHLNSKRPTV